MHRVVPAHVARHDLVAAAPVLNIGRERVVVRVGGGFGYICNKKKKGQKRGMWEEGKILAGWGRTINSRLMDV